MQNIAAAILFVLLAACARGGEPLSPQDRNGPCMRDKDCLPGLTCEGETKKAPGTCQKICQSNRDCGDGMLCRGDACQADCAETNEKCSDRRVCCFSDKNDDGVSDLACTKDEAGDLRCLFPA